MSANNTLNVCLGHLPFPLGFGHHIDLMVAPCIVTGSTRLALVDDSYFGINGSSLSEYVQLLWLLDNIQGIAAGCNYIRIFHYRRFATTEPPTAGTQSSNLPWATTIREADLPAFEAAFSRQSREELFNTPVQFPNGMLNQYAQNHILEDMLNFAKFLNETGILSASEVVEFLRSEIHIPSCNIGTFALTSYDFIFGVLRQASEFVYSPYFIVRPGYQRRSVGFLLERLNSFLIIKLIQSGACKQNFGHNMVISNDPVVSGTN
jgi:hypothetical protein